MYIGMSVNEIETPALVVDFDKLQGNINKMSEYLKQLGCSLRPHFKTHKCVPVAKMQVKAGAIGITCAKLGEAEILANSGIDEILIANQIIEPSKIRRLAGIARYSNITVAVDNLQNIEDLSRAAVAFKSHIGVLIEIEIGMGRCGARSLDDALQLAEKIDKSAGLIYKGIMGYEGHCVFVEKFEDRRVKTTEAIGRLVEFKNFLELKGFETVVVSGGGTGTYSITPGIAGMTEIQAGSYVFMDAKYRAIEDIGFDNALYLMATVISIPERGLGITDAGMKCLATDAGMPVVYEPAGVELAKLSEEHGKISFNPEITNIKVGDKIRITPSHICTTVNLHDRYYVTSDNIVTGVWNIDARGKFT